MTFPVDRIIDTHAYEFYVAYADTDGGGVIYHTRYIEHCERARAKMFLDHGISLKKAANSSNEGVIIVVSEVTCTYIASASFEDRVLIETRASSASGARMVFDHQIYSGGDLKAECKVVLACIDSKMRTAVRVPDLFKKVFNSN